MYICIVIKGDQFIEGGSAAKLGFPKSYGEMSSFKFYADLCVEIWEYCVKNGVRTFSIEMKKAQLAKLQIPCSVLLVDECQDLDGCQVAWIECQKKFGKFISCACQLFFFTAYVILTLNFLLCLEKEHMFSS